MNNPTLAPARREDWQRYRAVEQLLMMFKNGGLRYDEAYVTLTEAFKVSETRAKEILGGDERNC